MVKCLVRPRVLRMCSVLMPCSMTPAHRVHCLAAGQSNAIDNSKCLANAYTDYSAIQLEPSVKGCHEAVFGA